jgi:hypothetical protein
MELSPLDELKKRRKISACGDCRWDKRSLGQHYDSISGCSVLIGCRLQLMLDIYPMSNSCSKCMIDLPHDSDVCPKNVTCSFKGMEAIGSAHCVEGVFSKYKAYVREHIGDDDSSTKNVLRHSWKEEMERTLRDDVPRYMQTGRDGQTMGSSTLTTPPLSGWLTKDTVSDSLRANCLIYGQRERQSVRVLAWMPNG